MLSDRLKELRKSKGLTQIQFAKIFKIANGTVGNWETGNREPDNDMLIQIADYFNVSTDYLLGRSQEVNENKQKEPGDMTEAELDNEIISMLRSIPEDQVQRVRDFVAGIIAAREDPSQKKFAAADKKEKSSDSPSKS